MGLENWVYIVGHLESELEWGGLRLWALGWCFFLASCGVFC